ncbi:hypothetical protein OEZ85_012354 [Tetradesmus obliquus]|uniref:Uncharacterized protein n=1 Tax=Tetradesmus obliquus TaxID=3088 RepID=A0ABY8TT31_TETOB|nr:hypothetical protein OEZ85_012354 [Tetradesmus obliquus]
MLAMLLATDYITQTFFCPVRLLGSSSREVRLLRGRSDVQAALGGNREDEEMFEQAMMQALRILPHGTTRADAEAYMRAGFLRAALREMAMKLNITLTERSRLPAQATAESSVRAMHKAKTDMAALEAAHGTHINGPQPAA